MNFAYGQTTSGAGRVQDGTSIVPELIVPVAFLDRLPSCQTEDT